MPDASVRIVTRFAWHLAALSITSDDDLAKLPAADLSQVGGSPHFIELRRKYLNCTENARPIARSMAPDRRDYVDVGL
jgi:hypothetical protein